MSHITFNLHSCLGGWYFSCFFWLFGLALLRLVYSVFASFLFSFKLLFKTSLHITDISPLSYVWQVYFPNVLLSVDFYHRFLW